MILNENVSYVPERVISMVGPSRSGSSAIKSAVAMHPELTSLAGEEEPYYKLAHNGYPWHESDEFHGHDLNMGSLVRTCIANEVWGYHLIENRKWLQKHMIEEPPFVEVKTWLNMKPTLLLKTPQNCYRWGVIEQLYPHAAIKYIVTRRDRYATINGLMDGWSGTDFSARKLPSRLHLKRLEQHEDGMWSRDVWFEWWKFDMPPGWEKFTHGDVALTEVCAYQADTAALYCVRDYPDAITVEYEQFLEDWRGVTYDIWEQLGLDKYDLSDHNLPVVMATDQPKKDRWKEKRPWLVDVC